MKKSKTTPHDTFFKALLEDIQRARIFLSRLLPGELTGHFDMETLNRAARKVYRKAWNKV